MRALMIAAALAFTAAAPHVHAQPKDQSPDQTATDHGQCRGPDGKDAINAKCKGAGPAQRVPQGLETGSEFAAVALKKAACSSPPSPPCRRHFGTGLWRHA